MVGEGDGAVIALNDMSAGRALERAGEATAVEKENDLFILLEAFIDGAAKCVREDGIASFLFSGFDPHIDDAGEGKGGAISAFGQVDKLILVQLGVMEGLE